MRRVFALPLMLLLATAGTAAAQTAQPPPRQVPAIAVQEAELQQLLMYQYLQGPAAAPTVRGASSYPPGYFSNGAAVMNASSPYYSNGAAATALPPQTGAATNDVARLSGPADTTTGVPYYANGASAVAGKLDTATGNPYFANGATVTSIPAGSPYFANGSEATSTSAVRPPSPPLPPVPASAPAAPPPAEVAAALPESPPEPVAAAAAPPSVTATTSGDAVGAPLDLPAPATLSGETTAIVEQAPAAMTEPRITSPERPAKTPGSNTPWASLVVGLATLLTILGASFWSASGKTDPS